MAYPPPRSPSVHSVNSFVRRHSGAFNQGPTLTDRETQASSSSSNILTVQVEDAEHGQPTVLLVQKRRRDRARARVPSLPFVPPVYHHSSAASEAFSNEGLLLRIPEDASNEDQERARSPVYDSTAAAFSPVPLTPTDGRQPAHPRPPRSDLHTTVSTSVSTPGFGRHDPFHSLPSLNYAPERYEPSNRTSYTTARLKRGLSALRTTNKLTHKFPISQSVRGLSLKVPESGWSSTESFGSALQEGQGLGVERIDRWTRHKWCLFLSVCTIFVTGATGLVCALLTWFKGKCLNACYICHG